MPQAWRILKQGLLYKGYRVLESNDAYYGVPISIIIGSKIDKNHKQDFYGLADELRLPFKSEAFYIEASKKKS